MTWHKKDPHMTRLVKALPVPPPSKKKDPYAALLGSVISQQLSTKVARVIHGRFLELFEDGKPDAETIIKMKLPKLRGVGLSGQKAEYIRSIARFHLDSPITNRHLNKLSDDEVIEHLTQIKGVGAWTVQMLLMFPMNRPDVFPIDDFGIRMAMIDLYKVEETGRDLKKRLHEIADGWQPQRTLACKYLWMARDQKVI
jgi:DNA-3-methyladenine glycosylase II